MSKILVVEDDPDINKALCIRLEASGYEVSSATDGYMGLHAAMQQRPDLMILDISMPAGSGFTIVERLNQNSNLDAIPFIILTASLLPENIATAKTLGAVAFFEKPFESSVLLESIRTALSTPCS